MRGRARTTLDAIVRAEIEHLMRNDEPLPPTRSEVLASAKAGRAIPAADMAKVDFDAIAQAGEPELVTPADPLDCGNHPAIVEGAAVNEQA